MQLRKCSKALVALCFFFCYSSTLSQTVGPNINCDVTTYTGSNKLIDNAGNRSYDTDNSRCTTLDLDGNVGYIVDTTIGTDSNGNPVAVEGTDGSYTFSQNTVSNKIVSSTMAINRALQQAGVSVQFRGFGYEWEVKKPSSSSNLKLSVKIYAPSNNGGMAGMRGEGDLLYYAEYDYAGLSWSDWHSFDVDHTPYGTFTVEDDWYVKMTMEGNGQGSGIRGMKMTFSYTPLVGADDFDPDYDYGAADDFTAACSDDPLSSEQCSGYQQAYTNQQCANDPLYDSSCSGYEETYEQARTLFR